MGELSFRKKIILSQIVLFIVFFAALFPLIEKMASLLVRDSLEDSTSDLITRLEKADSEKEMIDLLKNQQYYSFFRMSIINEKGQVIYDTHLNRLLGSDFTPYSLSSHPEVQEALKEGSGYSIAQSEIFGGRFAYVAERFTFQGKTYILRTAFPYEQIQELTQTFKLGVLIFSFVILLFFNALIWMIFNRFTSPIREIVQAIKPYQRGGELLLPEITLSKTPSPNDEFQQLAQTLNSLSKRIKEQIESLTGERNEKEAILESLGEGVIAIDGQMIIRYANFIAGKMLGVSHKQLLGHIFPEFGEKVNIELLKRSRELLIKCQKENGIRVDSLSFGIERRTYIDLVAAPIAKGNGAILVLQDKTSHYRVLEMGKDFVANASHELRTPITIIKGYAETLQDIEEISQPMLREITEKINRNCERMEHLVHSLLTLADIENIPESRFKECDLVALLDNCRHLLLSLYPDALVEIQKTQDNILLSADASLLELAMINLLDNAAKYSIPPAKITIQIEQIEEEVRISIADLGKGIPKEDLEHIFERFYRVDKTHSRRLGGAGLGLSIVKTIIEKHDGTIEMQSELNKGTTFIMTLPMRRHPRV